MYRSATKRTGKKRIKENLNVSLLRHRQRFNWFDCSIASTFGCYNNSWVSCLQLLSFFTARC